MAKLVILESPYAGKTDKETERNVEYARACMKDCFMRGEYPFASHLLYIQPGILDDKVPEERTMGIEAGFALSKFADASVVYTDLGISKDMRLGIKRAKQESRSIEYRRLSGTDLLTRRIEELT